MSRIPDHDRQPITRNGVTVKVATAGAPLASSHHERPQEKGQAMSPETQKEDPATTGPHAQASVHVALTGRRRDVWLEVDLDGRRVPPETARELSALLADLATVAEKLRGGQPGSRSQQPPAAAPTGMPTQWQEVDHDEPRYTGPAQVTAAHGGQASGNQPAAPGPSPAAQQKERQ